ncbi:MAG: hypothetical protein AB1671_07820 [Thermodesulfobacteriota bacterium]|jgi:hypothetical protein
MARRTTHLNRLSETRDALAEYLAELVKRYPKGKEHCQVIPWPEYGEGSYLVNIPPPENEDQWIELSEQMAEVGTRILAQSDQLFVLTM